MWLGSLNLLPPIMMLLCVIISAFQVIQAFDNFQKKEKKGVTMIKKGLFDKGVWNLRWP